MGRDPDDLDVRQGRRAVLRAGALSLLALAVGAPEARAAVREPRRLRMRHTHTGERLDVVWDAGALARDARAEVSRFLRDFRTGDVHPIDPGVLETAWAIAAAAGRPTAVVEVVSGYRSARTNALLRERGSGVARHSLHVEGRALDFRMEGIPTGRVRDLALALGRGGVGYYAASDFVHVDTGRPRTW